MQHALKRFSASLTLTFCALTFSANAQTPAPAAPAAPVVEFVEARPDGSAIVRIDGVEHRALNADALRKMALLAADHARLVEVVAALKDQVKALEEIDKLTRKIESNQAEEIARLNEMLTATNNQLLSAMELNAQYQRLAKTGKLVSLLNSPTMKILMTLAPIAASVIAR